MSTSHEATITAPSGPTVSEGRPVPAAAHRVLTCDCGWWATGPEHMIRAAHTSHLLSTGAEA
jgi:hypothetical protein